MISSVISHINENNNLHPYVRDHHGQLIKASHNESFPSQVQEWNQWRRLVPKTTISATISQGAEIQFDLNIIGHVQTMYLEIALKENNTGNATLNPYDIFEKIEVECNNSGKKFRTLYPDDMFICKMLHRDLIDHNRKRYIEKLNSDFTPQTNNLPQDTTVTFIIEFDIFEGSQPDLRLLKYPLLLRLYMNQPLYFVRTGSSSDISLISLNILQRALDLPIMRYSAPLHHRYINYVRILNQKHYYLQMNMNLN